MHDRVEEVRGLLIEEHFHLRFSDFLLFQQIIDLDRRDAGIAGKDGAIPPAVGRLDPVGRVGLLEAVTPHLADQDGSPGAVFFESWHGHRAIW